MFKKIEEALSELQQGNMIIVIDDEDRENEGDLVLAAEFVTPKKINFMISEAKGLVCVPMKKDDLNRLELEQMVCKNTDNHQTAFTISVDHISNTTGISAYDRARTIKELSNPKNRAKDFRRPGHIFPLQAKRKGILQRAGHTEATIELLELAGLQPTGVICEIINHDGTMARLPDLQNFAKKWHLKIISIQDIIEYQKNKRSCVQRETTNINLPTKWGNFRLFSYTSLRSNEPHLALVKGNPAKSKEPVLCRIHSECFTGDLLGSLRCDCGDQLATALEKIEKKGEGILIYLRQEGRGIGLSNKLKAYELQDKGLDTVEANKVLGFPAELREFKIAADILQDQKINSVELLTNNPFKINELKKYNIAVDRVPLEIKPNCNNENYLKTKKNKMGHLLKNVSVKS